MHVNMATTWLMNTRQRWKALVAFLGCLVSVTLFWVFALSIRNGEQASPLLAGLGVLLAGLSFV